MSAAGFEPTPIRRTSEQRKLSRKAYKKPQRLIDQEKPGVEYEKYVPPKPNHRGA